MTFNGNPHFVSMLTDNAGDRSWKASTVHLEASLTMKSKKYRFLMVTPAFIEARKRKEINDFSYGRVLPTSSNEDRRCSPLTRNISDFGEKKPKTSPPQLMDSRVRSTDSKSIHTRCSATKSRAETGKHFLSWNIPKRIISAESEIKNSTPPPSKWKLDNKERWSKNSQGDSRSAANLKSDNSAIRIATQKQSPLPEIPAERRKITSPSSTEESNSEVGQFDKKWLRKFDKEERKLMASILKKPDEDAGSGSTFKHTMSLTLRKKSNGPTSPNGVLMRSNLPPMSRSTNILHKTSSVAWRRDSTWLQPTKETYRSWHGLPVYPVNEDISNRTALYVRPHKKLDSSFTIHPEWGKA